MPDSVTVPQETRERVEQIGKADLVIALASATRDPALIESAIARARESVAAFAPSSRTVIVYPGASLNSTAHDDDSTDASAQLQLLPLPSLTFDPSSPAQSLSDSFRVIFGVSQNIGAKVCGLVSSDLSTVTAEWITQLVKPLLENQQDIVAPCYARYRFEGLVNRGIIYPLVRALYGRRVRNPMGPDFGISSRLLTKIAPLIGVAASPRNRIHPVASLIPEAITSGMAVCQSHLGVRVYATTDWTDLGTVLSQVLGPLFADIERYAAYWQRIRDSKPVVEFGRPEFVPEHDSVVDASRLVESFQLGARNLEEIWGVVLPPSVLVELRKLARLQSAQFRMPDEVWARIVYDFVLGHRSRTINRDHLLRAITPLYLGWVASYALEMENADPDEVEQRLEKLCIAYEGARSYFVARWRWPDRFNP
jgi:hypothetical protein